MYYASFGLLALIIHIIINYGILKIRKANGEALQLSYKNFLSAVMVYYISDIAWGFLAEWKILPLVYTDTVIYFVTMALSVLFWTRYVVAYLNRGGCFQQIYNCCRLGNFCGRSDSPCHKFICANFLLV